MMVIAFLVITDFEFAARPLARPGSCNGHGRDMLPQV
jgi:hypothetical protein